MPRPNPSNKGSLFFHTVVETQTLNIFSLKKNKTGSGREKARADISLLVCDHNYIIHERKSEELRKPRAIILL